MAALPALHVEYITSRGPWLPSQPLPPLVVWCRGPRDEGRWVHHQRHVGQGL